MNGRRRGRDEYERDHERSPPSVANNHRAEPNKRASFAVNPRGDEVEGGEDVRSGSGEEKERDWRTTMGGAEKKEEFLRLCERAWDLFHS